MAVDEIARYLFPRIHDEPTIVRPKTLGVPEAEAIVDESTAKVPEFEFESRVQRMIKWPPIFL